MGGSYLPDYALVLSKYPYDPSHYWTETESYFNEQCPSYQGITIEQFRQITNSKTMSKSIQISRELLNDYYEAATTPQKEYLTEHFKLDGTTTDEAIRGLYEMACGAWKPRIKKNHPDCFTEDSKHFDFSNRVDSHGPGGIISSDVCESLGMCEDFIQIRNSINPETHCRSFYLTTAYDWELVKDGCEPNGDVWVLIPTKKLK